MNSILEEKPQHNAQKQDSTYILLCDFSEGPVLGASVVNISRIGNQFGGEFRPPQYHKWIRVDGVGLIVVAQT